MFDNNEIQQKKPGFNAQAFSHARGMVDSIEDEFQVPYELIEHHPSVSGMSKREYSRRPEIQEEIKIEALKGNIEDYAYGEEYIRDLNDSNGGAFDEGQLSALVHSIGPEDTNKLLQDPNSVDPAIKDRALSFMEQYENYVEPTESLPTSPYSEEDYSQDLVVDDEPDWGEQGQAQQFEEPQQNSHEQMATNQFKEGGDLTNPTAPIEKDPGSEFSKKVRATRGNMRVYVDGEQGNRTFSDKPFYEGQKPSSHLMADDGKNNAWPSITLGEKGEWKNQSEEEAKKNGEYYSFKDEVEARAFAREGNWKTNDYRAGGDLNTPGCGGPGEPPCPDERVELDEVTVRGNLSKEMKAYKDSLSLYNKSLEYGKEKAESYANYYSEDTEEFLKKDYDPITKKWKFKSTDEYISREYGLPIEEIRKLNPKQLAEVERSGRRRRYEEMMIDPIVKGSEPETGGIHNYEGDENFIDDAEREIKLLKRIIAKNKDGKTKVGGSYSSVKDHNISIKHLSKIIKEIKRTGIKPTGVLKNAELPPIPVFKKPKAPKGQALGIQGKGLDMPAFNGSHELMPSPFEESSWDVTSKSKSFQDRGTNSYSNSKSQKFKNKNQLDEYLKREERLGHKTNVKANYQRINNFEQGGQLQPGQSVDGLVTQFEGGGTHEQNPLGGIPQGQGANGKQNLVEEGETKWNDYVFSNAINLDGSYKASSGGENVLKEGGDLNDPTDPPTKKAKDFSQGATNKEDALEMIKAYKKKKHDAANKIGKVANEKAHKESSEKARLETLRDDFHGVQNGFLWNLPGSISPMAIEDLAIGGLGKGFKYLKGTSAGKKVSNFASELFNKSKNLRKYPAGNVKIDDDFIEKGIKTLPNSRIRKQVQEDFARFQTPEGKKRLKRFNVSDDKFKHLDETLEIYDHPSSNFVAPEMGGIKSEKGETLLKHQLHVSEEQATKIANRGTNDLYPENIGAHEVAHLIQPNKKEFAAIDTYFNQLDLKKNIDDVSSANLDYVFRDNTGSMGVPSQPSKEKFAFLREMRQSMKDKKYIKDVYGEINDADIIKFMNENPKDRITSFVKNNKKNVGIIKKLLNNIPAVAPVAIGLGAASNKD